jgi:hypothetical protein
VSPAAMARVETEKALVLAGRVSLVMDWRSILTLWTDAKKRGRSVVEY